MKRLPIVNLILNISVISALILTWLGLIESHAKLKSNIEALRKTSESSLKVPAEMVQYRFMAEKQFQVIDKRIQGNAIMSDYALAEAEAAQTKVQEVNALFRDLKSRVDRMGKRRPRSCGGW